MYHLRPFAYPWGATHPGLGNGFVCTFQEKMGGKKGKKVILCTNRSGTCGRGGSQWSDRVTYCRQVEERNPIECCSRHGFVFSDFHSASVNKISAHL